MRKLLLFIVVPILAGASILVRVHATSDSYSPTYPQGPNAIPLLREIWDVSAENIYPPHLAERFDSRTLEELEDQLRSDDNAALASDGTAIEGAGVAPDVVVGSNTGSDGPLAATLDHFEC